jgi:hypothetical protein
MRNVFAALGAGLLWGVAGCIGSGGSADDANGTAGDGSAGTGGPAYVPPRCHQTCQDYLTGYALTNSVWLIYNQNIPGLPGGSVDVSATCPLGGTAHITGTASGSTDGTTTVHLVFELTACRNSDEDYTLTFDGVVNWTAISTAAAQRAPSSAL